MAQANGVNARGKKKSVYLTICGIIVIMLITIALLAGCGDSSSDASGDTSASGATEGSGPAGGPMGGPMGGMGMGGMGMGMPGMMGGGAGASAAASAAVEEPAAPPAKPYPGTPEQIRSDPFVALPNPLGGGAGGARNQSLTNVMLPLPLLPEGGINIESVSGKETQTRRAAGILWGNDAYGLLQIGEETYIVQTGDEVAGYTVTGITRDSIVLYSPDLKKSIQIPLQGMKGQTPESYDAPSAQVSQTPQAAPQGISLPQNNGGDVAPGMPEWPMD